MTKRIDLGKLADQIQREEQMQRSCGASPYMRRKLEKMVRKFVTLHKRRHQAA